MAVFYTSVLERPVDCEPLTPWTAKESLLLILLLFRAAIDAVECQSTFDSSSVIALLAGGSKAMSTSMDEAEQSFQSGVDDATEQRLSPRDLVRSNLSFDIN